MFYLRAFEPVDKNRGMSSQQVTVQGLEQQQPSLLNDELWVTIVWDDPVNLVSYVTHVFCRYFGYDRVKSERLMMQVHMEGKAIVSSGAREAMERDVAAMHEFGLLATLTRGA